MRWLWVRRVYSKACNEVKCCQERNAGRGTQGWLGRHSADISWLTVSEGWFVVRHETTKLSAVTTLGRRSAGASWLITSYAMRCLVLVLLLCAIVAAQTNLVPNGDFELDENGDGIPDFWTFAGASHVKQQLVRDVGRDGKGFFGQTNLH